MVVRIPTGRWSVSRMGRALIFSRNMTLLISWIGVSRVAVSTAVVMTSRMAWGGMESLLESLGQVKDVTV